MFDARSILDAIVAGSSEHTRNVRESGGLGDIMGDILGQLQKGGGQSSSRFGEDQDTGAAPGGGGLGDILGKLGGALQGGGSSSQEGGRSMGDNPFGDILGRLGGYAGRESSPPQKDAGSAAPDSMGDVLGRISDLVANNKGAAGAIVGGLGGLLLGTRTGRSIMGRAARLGGLALIGTLAYKALKNFQAGAAPTPENDGFDNPQLPPPGSGFEADAMGNDDAVLFIRTMVAAAAADGNIDREEQQKIIGNLEQAGMDGEAMEFLAGEFNNPASVEDIVASVSNQEQAARVYTAARIAIEPDTPEEQEFLSYLAQRLELDSALAAHIDASAAAIKYR